MFSTRSTATAPNDQGVGWNVLASLQRVAVGFGLAALVGIPAGFAIGRFSVSVAHVQPAHQPAAAGVAAGVAAHRPAWCSRAPTLAAIWTIFICSIWPMVINTAVGVQRVPQDYLNVARVLNLSEWKVLPRSCSPRCCPTC